MTKRQIIDELDDLDKRRQQVACDPVKIVDAASSEYDVINAAMKQIERATFPYHKQNKTIP